MVRPSIYPRVITASSVEEGQWMLVARSTVKRFLTTAQRQITGAGDSVEEMVDKLDDVPRQIASKLRNYSP